MTTITTTAPTATTTALHPAPPLSDSDLNPNSDSFPSLPLIPTTVRTAPLLRLSLHKLLANDATESSLLFTAAKDLGFFYLDLRGVEVGDSTLADVERLFDVGREVFDLDVAEKEGYDWSGEGSYFGYVEGLIGFPEGSGGRGVGWWDVRAARANDGVWGEQV